MKKYFVLIILICFIQALFPAIPSAQEKEDKSPAPKQEQISNETSLPTAPSINKEKQSVPTEKKEIIHRSGLKSFFYSLCLGPRIGLEYNEGRKIRSSEAMCWIPLVGQILHFINAVDAGQGKTMSEIVAKEGLKDYKIFPATMNNSAKIPTISSL